MDSYEAGALVLARMAWADGEIADSEREYLASVLPAGSDVDGLLERAREHELLQLVSAVTHYPDRFVIVLRAAFMATMNLDLDPRERQLFEDLVGMMELLPEDRDLIRQEAADLATGDRTALHPRIAELQAESSFPVVAGDGLSRGT